MSSKLNIILKTLIGNTEKIYKGRFLGFLKDDEFNALIQKREEVAPRLETKPTQSIIEVARASASLPGSRLVMVVKKSGSETVLEKQLFVSPRCDYASSISDNEIVIELEDKSNALVIEEVKDEK